MLGSEDITGLLGGTPPDGAFRQGTVLTFNETSGLGTVSVAGGVLTNLPFLTSGGQNSYRPGDVVVLLKLRSSWCILGRVVTPGGDNAIGRYTELSNAFETSTVTNYSLTTTAATKCQLDVVVPEWAEAGIITASLMVFAKNTSAGADFLGGKILDEDGTFMAWLSGTTAVNEYATVNVTKHWVVGVTGLETFTIFGQAYASNAAWPINASNSILLQATVAWTSVRDEA